MITLFDGMWCDGMRWDRMARGGMGRVEKRWDGVGRDVMSCGVELTVAKARCSIIAHGG